MNKTRLMVRLALLSAIGVLLFYVVSFPLPFFPEFLTYDAGDIPALVAAFAFGPVAGVIVQFLKAFIGFLIGGSKAGWIGALANFLAGGTMAFVAGIIYAQKKTKIMASFSLLIGSAVTALVMGVVNYYWLLPLWGIPSNQVLPMLMAAIIPFNFTKFVLSSIVTFFLYKKVKNYLEVEDYKEVSE